MRSLSSGQSLSALRYNRSYVVELYRDICKTTLVSKNSDTTIKDQLTFRELGDRFVKILEATQYVCQASRGPEVLLLETQLFSDYTPRERNHRKLLEDIEYMRESATDR